MADNAMKLIYSLTLSADSSGVTISNLPQDYTDLYMEMTLRDTGGYVNFRLNGDSGASNYQRVNFYGIARNAANTTSNIVASGRGTNESAMFLTAGDDAYSMNWYHLLGYSSGTVTKVLFEDNAFVKPLGGAIGQWNYLWKNSAPVTSIVLTSSGSNTWKAGSTFNIYGIKCATPGAKATGGDNVFTDGAFWYHIFNTSGLLDVRQSVTADFLVVGGGGGGGSGYLGGGGAGGYRTSVGTSGRGASAESQLSLAANRYQVMVGGGGAPNLKGTDSILHTVTSLAGGAGTSKNGGSGAGGGAQSISPAAGIGTSGQGYDGGDGNVTNGASAGGGGAGGNGSAGSSFTGGNGGVGVTSSISGISVGYAGGGGGGGGGFGALGGTASQGGGAGGRANDGGSQAILATSGTTNTGGGGGSSYTGVGSNGGSGVVIVRYPV
jgi:hypothetical protein